MSANTYFRRKDIHDQFYNRLADYLEEEEVIQVGLANNGPRLLSSNAISLRELGRRAGLSPTYLSQVLNGKIVISPRAYMALQNAAKLFNGADPMTTRAELIEELRHYLRICGEHNKEYVGTKVVALQAMLAEIDELRELAERAVVALHMHSHAGLNAPGFNECRENLCGDWHELRRRT